MDTLLSIDLGTTACKAAVFASDGRRLGSATEDYPLSTPHPGWAEQDPAVWWTTATRTLRQALEQAEVAPSSVQGLSISSQGISFVPVDRTGDALGDAISWLDMRAQAEAAQISTRIGDQRLYALTGKRPSAAYVLPKLLWLRSAKPALFERMDKLLLAHDWLLYRLCEAQVTDYSLAGGTMLLDVTQLTWSDELLSMFDLDRARLPELAWAGTRAGALSVGAAAQTGLLPGTPVVVGGQDQKCAALGAAIRPGVATVSLGTAAAISCLMDTVALDPLRRIPVFPFVQPGKWDLEGVVGTAGAALRWARDTLWPGTDYATLDALAASSPPGSNGVRFYPHLAGATSPFWDGDAHATFGGLSLGTSRGDVVRSILEGVCYQIRANLEAMAPLAPIAGLVVFGGGARSPLWCTLLAQVTSMPVRALELVDVANWGACVLAGIGCGLFRAGEAPGAAALEGVSFTPDPQVSERYTALYQDYEAQRG